MKRILNRLEQHILNRIKQKETGTLLGGIKVQLLRLTFYINAISFGLILITAYHTTIHPLFPGIPFVAFLILLTVPIIGLLVFEYAIIYPSEVAFLQHQAWREVRNPMFGEIAIIKEDNKEILNRLQKIEATLNDRKD